jgi:6-phosphogluconolactonase
LGESRLTEESLTKTLLLSGSDGPDSINLLEFDDATGALSFVRALPGASDASWLTLDEGPRRRLYAPDHEQLRVLAFTIEPGITKLTPLGEARPLGANYACYSTLSPDRRKIAVATYGEDRVTVFDLDAAGAILPDPQVLRGTATAAPGHAHWVQWSPERDRIYIVDLGHDDVRVHDWDQATGSIGPVRTAFRTPKGHGPRHLAFHPNGKTAYLLTEHGNTLVALSRRADGTFEEIQTMSSLPADYAGKAQAAHIQISPDGTLVYVSNRGPHTIGVFRIAGDGTVSPVQQISTGGVWPRFFLLLGKHLIACNQQSGSIVVFDVAADGTLSPNGKSLALKAPVVLLSVAA